MPMVRAMRLLNSIEAGSTSSAQLQQYLTNGGIYSDFSSICQLPGQCNVLGSSSTALSAINGSALATTIVSTSSTSNYIFANNTTSRSLLQTIYRPLLNSCINSFPTYWNSFNTWTAVSSSSQTAQINLPDGSYIFTSIAYGNGIFLAVTNNLTTYTSTDGVNWTAAGNTTTGDAAGIAFGNIGGTNYWVVVFGGATAGTSTTVVNYSTNNGATWTAGTLPVSTPWSQVAFYGGTFVAIAGGISSSNRTAVSTNGTTWTAGGNLPSSAQWASLAVGPISGTTYWVAVAGYTNLSTAGAYSSNNGTTWTSMALPTNTYWQSVAYGNSRFVAVAGGNGKTGTSLTSNGSAYSTNGTSWTASTFPSIAGWAVVTYVNGYFTALTFATTAIPVWSTTGASWTNQVVNNISGGTTFTSSSCIASSGTLSVSLGNQTATSYVTRNPRWGWTCYNNPNVNITSNVAYGNGTWVICFTGGYYSSTDGFNWTANQNPYYFLVDGRNSDYSTSSGNFGPMWIGYLNNKWWMLGIAQSTNTWGLLFYSSDLIDWNTASVTAAPYGAMASSGNTLIAVCGNRTNPFVNQGSSATVAYSIDNGASFGSVAGLTNATWSPPFVAGGYFYTASSGSTIYRASVGSPSSWNAFNNATGTAMQSLAYGNGVWVSTVSGGNSLWYNNTTGTGTFTNNAVGTGNHYWVVFINGYFWVPDSNGSIYYSIDGVNWTKQNTNSNSLGFSQPFNIAVASQTSNNGYPSGNGIMFVANASQNTTQTLGAPSQ